ncbi:DUF885 domain-containing protein [Chitinophaga ginsengisegetis]|uniref:DUF885 domain-containing protein n=1 Tax=Chitinophaga ginsengisegetis TaxID=393003 RepID=UPI000DC01408|nr:DUF885 domain-containing protein [Chitinophaga ginsengisegetis]MDR6565568.1 uncharacterized protein (DUF885 family) [Chitinophaga ginsengisegetis]MDR6645297.1 uncharacterized protein (DUF885 family) [Chitinophaga ginsengisegetis]MDR6652112.1 uncharacterized protein (DUF885 family) [Chitinophaga ginsengisegetis]
MKMLQRKGYLLLSGALLAGACQQPGGHGNPQATQDSLRNLATRYYNESMALNPLQATQNGENQYNDQLPIDISDSYRAKADSFYASYQQAIKGIDTAALSGNDRITYDMLQREFSINREGLTFHDNLMPVQQFTCLPLTLAQLGSGSSAQPFKTVKDYQNFMHRMERFAIWTDTAIANMRRGMATGYVLPQSLVVKVIPQVTDLAKKDTANNVFYAPLKTIPDSLDAATQAGLVKDYTASIETYILPSFAKLRDFMQKEYLPKARTSSGIGAIPDGKAFYAFLIKSWTTTDLTPEEIFALGEKEVARIRGEMEDVKNSTGFKGDLPAFFASVRTDKKLRIFKTPAAILDSFKAIEDKIMPGVKKMYGHLPKTKFEIRQTEAYRAASASAEYMQGSADGTRPGVFYVPILDATSFSYTGMECLFLHEAIPGHHFQISLQQENDSLPKFRRFSWIGAYGEGYALYCESLGKELGLYTDPYMYFGRLTDEIHRAIRLVVDVGMHTKGWTREQAIKYMMDNEPVSTQEATAEIERYMAIPGQALSYKIGELKIRGLRNQYTKSLGSRFSLSSFHDELLKDGCVPLSVLEQKMSRWAAAQP